MSLLNSMLIGLKDVWAHKLRSLLTMLGIILGVASLVAMWFMARKRLENWAYWFVIDVVAIVIYALKGLYLFSGQYIIFLILCIMGYRGWSRSMSAPLEASKAPLHP